MAHRVRIVFCVFILLSVTTTAFTQSRVIDSLRVLSENSKGIQHVDALNQLAWAMLTFDASEAKGVALEAMKLSEEMNYEKGKAEALIYVGICEFSVGNDAVSIRKLKESVALSKRLKQDTLQGFALAYLGLNYQNLDRLDSSFYYLNQSNEILKDSIQPYYLSFLYLILADHYGLSNEPGQQLKYLRKCWIIRTKLHSKRYLVFAGERLSSYLTQRGQYTEALAYLQEAQNALGKDTVNSEEITVIYKERAIINVKKGNYPKALKLLSTAIKFYERNAFTKELTNTFLNVGDVFVDLDNYEASLKNYFKALNIAEKNHYELERARLFIQIGRVYFFLDQFKLASEFALKGLEAAHQFNHLQHEASALNLLGLIADEENRDNESLQYFERALSIRNSIHDQVGIAGTIYNMGILFEKKRDFKKALDYQLQSLVIEESLQHQIGIAYSYQSLGELYLKMRDFYNAEQYLDKAEKLAIKIKSGKTLVDVYKNRRDILIAKQKFEEAVTYSILYETMRDSILNENLSTRIATLQNIFELDQKDNAIALLDQQQELQRKKLEVQESQIRQQWIVILAGTIGFIGLGVVAIIIYRYYARIKLLNRVISERNEEIQTQSEELTESVESLSKLNRAISEKSEEIQAQSEELTEANEALIKLNREISEQKEEIQAQSEELTEANYTITGINESLEERIESRTSELKQAYKELDTFFYRSSHDFRRPLTTFMGLAEVAKITIKDSAALELFERVNETAHNLDKMLMKLQSISDLGVRELIYKEIFLEEIFKREVDQFDQELLQKNIRTEIEVDRDLSFHSYPALVKIMMDNLIENAISFRGQKDPFIRLKAYQDKSEVVIEVEDNGHGIEEEYIGRVFDMYFRGNENSKGNGLGLYIVKKTAGKLKAHVTFESRVGKGSKVSIYFPLQIEHITI